METVYNVIVLSICLNVGIGMVSEAFGVDIPLAIDLEEIILDQEALTDEVATGGGFNPLYNFGDFVKALQIFINSITGQYLLATINMAGGAGVSFPPILMLGLGAIYAVAVVYSIIYLVSGRGTKGSA